MICDLTMPHMTGLDLAYHMHQKRQRFPVLIITGFGIIITIAALQRYGIKRFRGKPVVLREQFTAVRAVLDN